jgi:hypothetical protein
MTNHETYPLWQLLNLIHDHNNPVHLTFEECIELLEFDAEILASTSDIEEIRPILEYHLSLCSENRENLAKWFDHIEELIKNNNSNAKRIH